MLEVRREITSLLILGRSVQTLDFSRKIKGVAIFQVHSTLDSSDIQGVAVFSFF